MLSDLNSEVRFRISSLFYQSYYLPNLSCYWHFDFWPPMLNSKLKRACGTPKYYFHKISYLFFIKSHQIRSDPVNISSFRLFWTPIVHFLSPSPCRSGNGNFGTPYWNWNWHPNFGTPYNEFKCTLDSCDVSVWNELKMLFNSFHTTDIAASVRWIPSPLHIV